MFFYLNFSNSRNFNLFSSDVTFKMRRDNQRLRQISTTLFKIFIFNVSSINFAHNHDKYNNTQIKLFVKKLKNKTGKLENIIIKNNLHKPTYKFNVVYQYNCNKGQRNSQTYIGYT